MGYTIDYAEFKDSSVSASKLPEGETEHITTGSYACNVNLMSVKKECHFLTH